MDRLLTALVTVFAIYAFSGCDHADDPDANTRADQSDAFAY